ncbi:MAG: hypothetical protein HFE79_10225 [Ruminiclostridium sp.]|nr:hypothetical protein [Ruminiclostridium sp.]
MIVFVKLLFYIIFFIFTVTALYNIAGIIFRLPTGRITKTLKNASMGNQKRSGSDINHQIAVLLSKIIVINEYKRNELEEKLAIADIDETPEVYKAQGFLIILEFGLLAILLASVFPVFAAAPIIIGFVMHRNHKNIVTNAVKDLQEQIDIDLPRFVYSMKQEMLVSHDVLTILERHKNDYSDHWRKQMSITVADMRSGNYEAALQRLEGRVGSTNLSEVVRGLIEMSHGSDMSVYWETLQVRFSEMRKAQLRKIVKKIPDKIHNLSLWLIGAMLSIYIVVLITQLAESMSVFM